jgi:transcriptional regulator with XRE-family HTH domain
VAEPIGTPHLNIFSPVSTQGYLSSLERGEKEAGASVLLAISREFGRSVDWLLTGQKPKYS